MYSTVQIASDSENSDRHVLLRILRLLRRGRDGVESDIGEEDDARRANDARPAELAEGAGVRRNERVPVRGVHVQEAEADHEQHDRDLHVHDHVVEPRRLLDADDEQNRHRDDERDGGQIDDAARYARQRVRALHRERRRHERRRQIDAESMEERAEVPRPSHRHGRRAEEIFEHQIPADDPRDELAERRVAIGVRAAGDRNHRRELRVAESGEETARARENEGVHDRRSGVQRRGGSGENEDSCADDCADSQQRQITRGEHAFERIDARLTRFVLKHCDAFSG